MTNIAALTPNANLLMAQNNTKTSAMPGDFDAVMAEANTRINGTAASLIQEIMNAMDGKDRIKMPSATRNAFPLSSEFESVFGTTGPLIEFINMVTTKLGLSAEKNQALQDICVRNKDITNTPENVAKIGKELKEAGIG